MKLLCKWCCMKSAHKSHFRKVGQTKRWKVTAAVLVMQLKEEEELKRGGLVSE